MITHLEASIKSKNKICITGVMSYFRFAKYNKTSFSSSKNKRLKLKICNIYVRDTVDKYIKLGKHDLKIRTSYTAIK